MLISLIFVALILIIGFWENYKDENELEGYVFAQLFPCSLV